MEFMYVGAAPHEEECVQVSSTHDYLPAMRRELAAYSRQLTRVFPPPEGACFTVKWESHDFGSYGEVVAKFDPQNQAHVDWALAAELGCDHWDALARAELGLAPVEHEAPVFGGAS